VSILATQGLHLLTAIRYGNRELPKEAYRVLNRRRCCTHSAGRYTTRESSNQTGRLTSCLSTSDYGDGEMRCLGYREWKQSRRLLATDPQAFRGRKWQGEDRLDCCRNFP